MTTLLEGIGLKKAYRMGASPLEVLRGIDLLVKAGEMLAVVGPSGAGKSTLLHLLGGLDRPSSGQVRFQGKDLYTLTDRERALIRNRDFGFVFQFYHLVPELTALENVALPGWMGNGSGPARERLRRAQDLLTQVGLEGRASHRPAELSGGEQQRVAIARALVNRPTILFCDEPTGNLDSETGQQVLKILTQLHQEEGTTLIIVTHEPAVTRVAGRVLKLKDGQLWG